MGVVESVREGVVEGVVSVVLGCSGGKASIPRMWWVYLTRTLRVF